MKGKIDKEGLLLIERVGIYEKQGCPYKRSWCGDMCPLFGEPFTMIICGCGPSVDEIVEKQRWRLELCKKTLAFDEFEDERVFRTQFVERKLNG